MKSLKYNEICYIQNRDNEYVTDVRMFENGPEVVSGTTVFMNILYVGEIIIKNAQKFGIEPAVMILNGYKYPVVKKKNGVLALLYECALHNYYDHARVKCKVEYINKNAMVMNDHNAVTVEFNCSVKFFDKNDHMIVFNPDVLMFSCSLSDFTAYSYCDRIGHHLYVKHDVKTVHTVDKSKEYHFRAEPIILHDWRVHTKFNDLEYWNYGMSCKGLCMSSFKKITDEHVVDDNCNDDFYVIKVHDHRIDRKFKSWRYSCNNTRLHHRSWKETTKKRKQWM